PADVPVETTSSEAWFSYSTIMAAVLCGRKVVGSACGGCVAQW
ncbi:MAG: hypothetical protein ACI8RZ_008089, partial [Myxococcota bacterium]